MRGVRVFFDSSLAWPDKKGILIPHILTVTSIGFPIQSRASDRGRLAPRRSACASDGTHLKKPSRTSTCFVKENGRSDMSKDGWLVATQIWRSASSQHEHAVTNWKNEEIHMRHDAKTDQQLQSGVGRGEVYVHKREQHQTRSLLLIANLHRTKEWHTHFLGQWQICRTPEGFTPLYKRKKCAS